VFEFKLKKMYLISSMILMFLTCCKSPNYELETIDEINITDSETEIEAEKEDVVPYGATALINSYPEINMRYEDNKIYFDDGTYIIYDDEKTKDYFGRLENCDVDDMYYDTYDLNVTTPDYQYDPGRYRCDELFKKIYGSSSKEVLKNLTTVHIFSNEFLVTKINGVNKKLEVVARELEQHKEFEPYFIENAGSFNWRAVSNTERLSAHSYGIAIDINSKMSNFWKWDNSGATESSTLTYNNSIPLEIVDIFEKNGFIWGGRWYHYDTMHFEYRPDLMYK
jgi:hypothetical protein